MGIVDRIFKNKIEQQAMVKAQEIAGNAINLISANTRRGGAGEKWSGGLARSGQVQTINHYEARQNARNAYHDTPQAKAIVERFSDTVVDIGLKIECAPKADILNISPESAEIWAEDVEERFDSWCKSKKQHRAETMNFYQMQRLYMTGQQRDGENFTRLFYSPARDLLNPLQFDLIDPNQIRGDSVTSTNGFISTSDGIKRDSRGREISYDVWFLDEKGKYKTSTIPAKGVKSGRYFMLHGFAPEYAGQKRGYSRLAHAIQEFENITDFSSAAIKKAINQSMMVGFVEPSDDAPASNPMEGFINQNGAGPVIDQFGSKSDEVLNPTIKGLSTCSIPEFTNGVPGSNFITNLQEGEKI